jgi:hypothetical protein
MEPLCMAESSWTFVFWDLYVHSPDGFSPLVFPFSNSFKMTSTCFEMPIYAWLDLLFTNHQREELMYQLSLPTTRWWKLTKWSSSAGWVWNLSCGIILMHLRFTSRWSMGTCLSWYVVTLKEIYGGTRNWTAGNFVLGPICSTLAISKSRIAESCSKLNMVSNVKNQWIMLKLQELSWQGGGVGID